MELEEYKEMSDIVIRQINNCKDELNKAIKHEKKNKIGMPSKCNDFFMEQILYKWEQNIEPKNVFCGPAKLNIDDTLYLLDEFCKR